MTVRWPFFFSIFDKIHVFHDNPHEKVKIHEPARKQIPKQTKKIKKFMYPTQKHVKKNRYQKQKKYMLPPLKRRIKSPKKRQKATYLSYYLFSLVHDRFVSCSHHTWNSIFFFWAHEKKKVTFMIANHVILVWNLSIKWLFQIFMSCVSSNVG